MGKRVLFITFSLAGGGAERVVSILGSNLAEEGKDIHLIIYDRKEKEYPISPKVKLYVLEPSKGKTRLSRLINRVLEIRKLVETIKPDVVVPFLAKPTEHMFLATQGMKLKLVCTIRNNPKLYPSQKSLRFFVNWITKKAERIMLQTDEQRCYFKNERDKTFVVYNPVKQEMLDAQYYYRTEIRIIATFGRLKEQKNQRLLIEAFSEFLERHSEFELNIWGEGEQKEKLEQLVIDKGLDKKIHLMGSTQNVKKELLNTDIFVLSSNYEGLPNSLMEAMAVGVPSISTNCPTGPKDLIDDNVNGLLVATGSKEELVAAMSRLADDFKMRKFIGTNAKKTMQNFTEGKISNDFWRNLWNGF